MRCSKTLIALLCGMIVGCSQESDPAVLQGTWKLQRMAGNFTFGLPQYQLDDDYILSLEKDAFTFITSKRSGKVAKGTYRCDNSKTPTEITFTFADRSVVCIYSLMAKELQICLGEKDLSPPSTFDGGPESRPALLVFLRQ